jgi:hypothetical protein
MGFALRVIKSTLADHTPYDEVTLIGGPMVRRFEGATDRLSRRRRGVLLGEIADLEVSSNGDVAIVRLLDSSEDAHEGRLARAVRADETDAVAIVDRKGEIVEEGLFSETL